MEGGNGKGLGDKMDEEDKEKVKEALEDGESWMSSNHEADAEEIKDKHKEIEGICAPIVSKYYQGGAGSAASTDDEGDDDEAHDEL